MDKNPDTLKAALARPVQELEAWLDARSIGGLVEHQPFNWQLFAFSLAEQATTEHDLLRARLALRVYECLAHHESDSAAFSLLYSAMNLRAWMICELGARQGHPVLDPEPIVAWLRGNTELSVEQVRALCSVEDWSTLPIETLRQLRKIKNMLNPLELVSSPGLLQHHPELASWLELREHLP